MSSTDFDETFTPTTLTYENHFPADDHVFEAGHSMRVLDRLASTLGVPVEIFFEGADSTGTSNDPTPEEFDALTRAFAAIADPSMRRYCLDVIRMAGADGRSNRAMTASV